MENFKFYYNVFQEFLLLGNFNKLMNVFFLIFIICCLCYLVGNLVVKLNNYLDDKLIERTCEVRGCGSYEELVSLLRLKVVKCVEFCGVVNVWACCIYEEDELWVRTFNYFSDNNCIVLPCNVVVSEGSIVRISYLFVDDDFVIYCFMPDICLDSEDDENSVE